MMVKLGTWKKSSPLESCDLLLDDEGYFHWYVTKNGFMGGPFPHYMESRDSDQLMTWYDPPVEFESKNE